MLQDFLHAGDHPIEFAVLACARIDSLANLAGLGKTDKEKFVNFVAPYSGQRRVIEQSAVPNLYSYLGRQYHMLLFTLERPGRIQQFDRDESMPFLRYLAESELPLTEPHIARYMRWFSREIQRVYRTTATQRRSKPTLVSRSAITRQLKEAASSRTDDLYLQATRKLGPLVRDFSIGSVLYRDFRSSAIHEYGFSVSERFFREEGLFIDTVQLPFEETIYLDVQFSAKWLRNLLVACLENFQAQLVHSKKLPPALFFEVCELPGEVDFLDDEALDEPRFLTVAVPR